jgi:cytoskeletal protein RodZ
MTRFGDYLRAAREAQSVTLEQISTTTHISVRLLEALEGERFDILPGGVFTISFVRQYANLVGLDPEEAVSRLKQVARPVESALGEWNTHGVQRDDAGAKLAEFFTDFVRRKRMTLSCGLATVVQLAGGFLFFQANEGLETELASEPASNTPQTAAYQAEAPRPLVREARPVEVSHAEDSAPDSAAAGPAKAIQLELRLTDRAWVRVVADGERVLEANLDAGFVQTIRAEESMQLVVGNAGGVKVALNGETMQPIGPPGHVRRVDVSTSGMEVVEIEPKPGSEATVPESRPSRAEI